jgi:hypothetical protein
MAFIMDPKIAEMVGQSPNAELIRGTMEAHIGEHLACQYRQRIEEELGVKLPPPEEPLPPELENTLSGLVADAANRVLYRSQEEAAQKKAQEVAADPLYQLEVRKQELAEKKFEHQKLVDLMGIKTDMMSEEQKATLDTLKLGVQLAIAEDEHDVRSAESVIRAATEMERAMMQRDAARATAAKRSQ